MSQGKVVAACGAAAALVVAAVLLVARWPAPGAGPPEPYAMPRTQVRRFHSDAVGQDYLLYVSLPRGHAQSAEPHPLVVTLDAEYAFGLVRNVVEHFVDRNGLPPLVLVSVAYPGASEDLDTYRRTRTRDYTPTHTPKGGYSPQIQQLSGGGPVFRSFLETELLPFLQRTYRTDPADQTLVGHSFGGLFGAYVLLTRPALFRRHILVSPSLWYDQRTLFALEEQRAAPLHGPPLDVFLAVGADENARMVDDMQQFAERLRTRAWPGLKVTATVFSDENHDSIFPAAATRGLRTVFSGR